MKLKTLLFIFIMASSISSQCLAGWKDDLETAYEGSNYKQVRILSAEHAKEIFEGTSSELKFIAGTALWDDASYKKNAHDALESIYDKLGEEDKAIIDQLFSESDED